MDTQTQKQLHEIGTRYIQAALAQLSEVQALAARIHDGEYPCLADLEHLTHQLYGSAAMFGFDAVSAAAGKISALLKSFSVDPATWDLGQLDHHLVDLGDALHDGAASRARRSADKRTKWPDESRTS
jgi:HPt (histidine-containing phosphotransfer) domain-containing protein